MKKDLSRCHWLTTDQLYIDYHDHEWGKPVHDDQTLFEMLTLEGAQAGLSWLTVLKRREGYRKAFDTFSVDKVAAFAPEKVSELMNDVGIIRNRLKILSTIENAQAILAIQKEYGSFDTYIWNFVANTPIPYEHRTEAIAVSETMSRALKKRGFRFVGPTICFAFMQATGMVQDHGPECFLHGTILG